MDWGKGKGGNLLTRSAQLEAADTYSAQSNDSPVGGRMSQEAAAGWPCIASPVEIPPATDSG